MRRSALAQRAACRPSVSPRGEAGDRPGDLPLVPAPRAPEPGVFNGLASHLLAAEAEDKAHVAAVGAPGVVAANRESPCNCTVVVSLPCRSPGREGECPREHPVPRGGLL